jgi:hypothetical protein
VRWRRVDLKRVIKERFCVEYHERHVGTLLKRLGFSQISARPRHPGQNFALSAFWRRFCDEPLLVEKFGLASRGRLLQVVFNTSTTAH